MTDRPDVSPWRKLIGITLLCSLFVLPAPVLAQDIADPLRLVAEDAASCRELRDPDIRLACFDAAAHRLAEALGSMDRLACFDAVANRLAEVLSPMDQAGPNAGDLPIVPDAPIVPEAPDASAAVEPSGEAAERAPYWAAAPQPQPSDIEQDDVPRRFEATIVRITSNNAGRHRFYTADGAVWEQTQIAEIRPPKSLPAVAEFRRRLTGSPTIKFDVSSRSYRVKRIE